MTRLFLLRHGAIDWPEADCYIGQTDAPLSAEGRLQAEAWRRHLPKAGPSGVFASDLTRTLETARIIFGAGGFETRKGLREIHLGEWDGLPRSRVKRSFPDLWHARGKDLAGFRPPGGESFQDVQERAVGLVEKIAARTTGTVCLVTHAGVIRALICHFLQMPLCRLFRIRVDYAGLSIVSCSPPRIEVCALNLRSHEAALGPD